MKDSVDAQSRNQQVEFRNGRSRADEVAIHCYTPTSLIMRAFDNMDGRNLCDILQFHGILKSIVSIKRNSYDGLYRKVVCVCEGGQLMDMFQVETSLRQTRLLSSFLYPGC